MTKEEREKAIDALKISAPVITVTQEEFYDYIKTLNKIMNWLEQEPCTDAISRQAVLDLAKFDGRDGLGSIIHAFDVEQLPPVKPAEKVGQWIDAEVLDKIRDEIVHLHDWAFDREEILRIIDKYKAESEG